MLDTDIILCKDEARKGKNMSGVYPAGMTGEELDDASLDEVIDNADRKELTRMIFEYMETDLEKELLHEMIDAMSPSELEGAIEELLYDKRNVTIAQDYIKDNCPEIAE